MASITERKTKDGVTHYKVVVRLKGARTQTATFERKTDAQKWVQKIESSIREGRHFDAAEGRRKTFADMLDEYQLRIVPIRHTKIQARRAIECHLLWWKRELGHLLLSEVKPADIARCRDRLLSEPARNGKGRSVLDGTGAVRRLKSPATAIRYLASLSVVYSTAENEWGWVSSNPVKRVRRPIEPRGRVRFLSDAERAALLSACRESTNPYLYLIVVLALSTGARQGEIVGLRWSHVDLERGVIRLEETKNGERRALPVTGYARELLQKHFDERDADSSYVFPSLNGKKPIEMRRAWRTAVARARIDDFRFHDLRHSAASYLAMNGATLAEIAEVLGHKTLQMVKRYAHLSEQHTAKVVARMNEQIFKTTDNNGQQEKG